MFSKFPLCWEILYIQALSRENVSLGFATRQDSTICSETSWNIPTFHVASLAMIVVLRANNNGVFLDCTFVVHLLECQVFSDKAHTNHIVFNNILNKKS